MSWLKCVTAMALVAMTGCQDKGFDLEFHMPSDVDTIELTIDQSNGAAPRRIGGHVYAIDLDDAGKAKISGAWPITRYHRTFIVTRTSRLQEYKDFQVIDSGWRMNKTVVRAGQSVTSTTKLEGSVHWMKIKK